MHPVNKLSGDRITRHPTGFTGEMRGDPRLAGDARAGRSGHESSAETQGNGLRTIARPELAEQSTGVRLDGVLGQEQLAADLTVGLTLAHSAQYLHFSFGQRSLAVHRFPDR